MLKKTICPRCHAEETVKVIHNIGNRIRCGKCGGYYSYSPRKDKYHVCGERLTSSGMKFW